MKIHVPRGLKEIGSRLYAHGFQSFIVGGAVRDSLLKRTVKDYDLATDAKPEEVMRIFRRVIPTGIQHGTVTVLSGKEHYEVTTFRVEGAYSDGRRPDSVSYSDDLDIDLKRRDFTINAMAYNLHTERLYDPFGGKTDLVKKIIRAIGDPDERLKEDALRMLRAARFAAQLGFAIEAETQAAMKRNAPQIGLVSAERIRDELVKLLESERPSVGFTAMENAGLLDIILPELAAGRGVKQPSLHCFDVYLHSLYSCDGAHPQNLIVRLAALLHDIGKPLTAAANDDGDPCFYGHEQVGADLCVKILSRLRFPGQLTEKVSHLVACHMFQYDATWTDAAIRRFIRRVFPENIPDLIALRRADQFGMCGTNTDSALLRELEHRIESEFTRACALSMKDLAINGEDIIRELSIPEGKSVGLILNFCLESVLDDPALNTRTQLLLLAQRFFDERINIS